jgi:gamma-polyglutamate biosynthesis protein CapA
LDKTIHRSVDFQRYLWRGAIIILLLALTACNPRKADYTITFGGDVMLSRGGSPVFGASTQGFDPWGTVLNVPQKSVLSKTVPDYLFVNLESPLNGTTGSVVELTDMNLCSDSSTASILTKGNVFLVNLANNHKQDCGVNGSAATQRILDGLDILVAGPEQIPTIFDTPNGRVAVIAADDVTAPIDLAALTEQIEEVRKNGQVVIVSVHWGNEYQTGPDERQQTLAQAMADAGADIIWGHHPHVLQKTEWLTAASGRRTLVMYSMGNLLFDQWMLEDAKRTALLNVSFKDSSIVNVEVTPLNMDRATKQLQRSTDAATVQSIIDRLQVDQFILD